MLMQINDPVLKLIKKFHLPLRRDDKSVRNYLDNYFESYIESLSIAVNMNHNRLMRDEFYEALGSKLQMIKRLVNGIIEVLDAYDSAEMKLTYEKLNRILFEVKDYLYLKDFGNSKHVPDFYRIRVGNSQYGREELFHIPFSKRKYIKPYRYSIAGYPCLYLSDSTELSWFECGMPNEFSVSKYRYSSDKQDKFKVIDFSKNPLDLITSVPIWYYNYPEDKSKIDEYVLKYLISHPLRAACSIQVRDRNVPFIEEYIFPQLLLLWIRQNDYFDGVAYSSSSAIDAAHDWNSYNIVLPAKNIKNDYCVNLMGMFKISNPRRFALSELVEKYEDKIITVRSFLSDVESKYMNGKSYYLFREVMSLCKSFLFILDSFRSGKTNDPELLYQMIDTLNLQAYIIADNKEILENKMLEKVKEYEPHYNIEEVRREYYDVLCRFEKDVKSILFNFWSYAGKIRSSTNINDDSLEFLSVD